MNLKENMVYCQERVNNYLKAYLDNLPEVAPKLRDAMAYGVLLGGKRVRPFLVYNVAKSLGIDYDLADAPAAAIECIHAYSLIHDDLPAMDDDSLRRGHPTCHVKFGEATAILAGDALQTMAFEILGTAAEKFAARGLTANLVEMYKVLARGSGYAGMCGGQELDLEAEGLLVSQEALEKVHRHKTGALIESAVDLGLLLNPTLPQGTKEAYASYARGIGLAFQVWDDVLHGESYYMVEIKSIKRILDLIAHKEYRVLCFVDEVLRGTNTVERIAASSQILKSLNSENSMCFVATHDIELTSLLEDRYENYHFREEVTDGDVTFSYQLLPGKATPSNWHLG